MLNNVIQESLNRSPQYLAFLKEEAAEQARKTQKLVEETSAPLRKEVRIQRELFAPSWSKPVPVLKEMFRQAQGNKAILTQWYWPVLLRFDNTPISQDPTEAAKIFDEFVEKTLPSQGWRLSVAGCTRLWAFCYVQQECGGNPITPESLTIFFSSLKDAECFDADAIELSYTEPAPVKAPEYVPTANDLETINLSSEEGQRQGRAITTELFNREAAPVVQRWCASLLTRFQFDISQEQLTSVEKWISQHNKSPRDIRALEQCRVALVKSGVFPEACLDHDDLKSLCIEALPSDDWASLRIVFHGSLPALKKFMAEKGISIY